VAPRKINKKFTRHTSCDLSNAGTKLTESPRLSMLIIFSLNTYKQPESDTLPMPDY